MINKNKKDYIFIIVFILGLTFSLGYLFQVSYAKYKKQINSETHFSISQWHILVNNEDITGKKVLEQNLTPIYDKNPNTNDLTIAPGSTGYIDLTIDASNVDVTFDYKIETSIPKESAVSDLKITHYQINPNLATSPKIEYDNLSPITGKIIHNTKKTSIRLYIIWDDSETNTMDNQADTIAGATENAQAIIKTSITFTQSK